MTSTGISLLRIDYNLLVNKDPTEINKLLEASKQLGFFYLKLDNELDSNSMFTLAEKVFELPLDDKMRYEMDGKNGVYFGYKGVGTMYGENKTKPDTIEFWNISKDEIIQQDSNHFPQIILDTKDTVKEFMINSHKIVIVLLEILSIQLELDSQTLPNLHRLMQPSGDQLRLTKSVMYPIDNECSSNVSLGAHTDFGSVTILFNRLGGLQVLTSDGKWLDIEPMSGYAIVNLGDALVKLTNRRINSNIHRVVNISGLTQITNRYSIVYFSRPENHVQMKSLFNCDEKEQDDNYVFTAQQWIEKRVKDFQLQNSKTE